MFAIPWEDHEWQAHLRGATRDEAALQDAFSLPRTPAVAASHFPARVPAPFARRIRTRSLDDPLLKQVMPSEEENIPMPGFTEDPLGEASAVRAPGLLQKYRGRALMIVTGACAVHCRYCFRKNFPYSEHGPRAWEQARQAVAEDTSIQEIILSGGDPLAVEDAQFISLLNQLAAIDHIRRIRIHTRFPVVIPQRITRTLLSALAELSPDVVMVIHANHADELDADTGHAFSALAQAGVRLLNQSVLLAGVNDDEQALAELSERLFSQQVLPYYLNMLDPVAGTHHFHVAEERAQQLMTALHARLPGYLVPRLVAEIPGKTGKTPIYWTTSSAKHL